MALEAKKRLRWPDWADPAPPSLVWYPCKACPFPERSLGLGKGGAKPQSRLWGRAGAPQAPSLTACLFPIPGLKGSQVSQMRKRRLKEAKDSPGTMWPQTRQGYQPRVRAGSGQPLCSPRRPFPQLPQARCGPAPKRRQPALPAGSLGRPWAISPAPGQHGQGPGRAGGTALPTRSRYCYLFLREATFASEPGCTAVLTTNMPGPTPSAQLGRSFARDRGETTGPACPVL